MTAPMTSRDPSSKDSAQPAMFGLFLGLIWALVALDALRWVFSGESSVLPYAFRTFLSVWLWSNLRQRRNWARVTLMVIYLLSFGSMLFLTLSGGFRQVAALSAAEKVAVGCWVAMSLVYGWCFYYLNRSDVRAWFNPKP